MSNLITNQFSEIELLTSFSFRFKNIPVHETSVHTWAMYISERRSEHRLKGFKSIIIPEKRVEVDTPENNNIKKGSLHRQLYYIAL